MEAKDLKKLVSRGEGSFLEFKKKTVNLEKMVKELIAFANTRGGTLLIGVSDSGQITGLLNPDGDQFLLDKAIRKHAIPMFTYECEQISLNNHRSVIAVHVSESKKKPHYFRPEPGKYGSAYIRFKDECIRASREMKNLLRYQKRGKAQLLTIGESEQELLSVFEEEEEVTLNVLASKLKMKRREISDVLVKLTAAGILNIEPRPRSSDVFRQVQSYSSGF